jgi:hypothetical protein
LATFGNYIGHADDARSWELRQSAQVCFDNARACADNSVSKRLGHKDEMRALC